MPVTSQWPITLFMEGRVQGRGKKLKTASKHDLTLPIKRFGKVGPLFSIKK
jgi:hypothetical protein